MKTLLTTLIVMAAGTIAQADHSNRYNQGTFTCKTSSWNPFETVEVKIYGHDLFVNGKEEGKMTAFGTNYDTGIMLWTKEVTKTVISTPKGVRIRTNTLVWDEDAGKRWESEYTKFCKPS